MRFDKPHNKTIAISAAENGFKVRACDGDMFSFQRGGDGVRVASLDRDYVFNNLDALIEFIRDEFLGGDPK